MGGLFLALLFAAGLSLTVIGYRVVSRGVERSAMRRSDAITRAIARELDLGIHVPIASFVNRAARGLLGQADTPEKRRARLPLLLQVLQTVSFAKCVILGLENGDFFFVLHLDSETEKREFGAPPEAVLAVLDCHGPPRPSRATLQFFDNYLNPLGQRPFAGFDDFDPRTRAWYIAAMQSDRHVETGPFHFFSLVRQGIVVSEKSAGGNSVVGVIMDLQRVSDILDSERPTPGSRIALFNSRGSPIAGARNSVNGAGGARNMRGAKDFSPAIQQAMALYAKGERGDNLSMRVDGSEWLVSLEELAQFAPTKYVLAVAIPRAELFAEAGDVVRDGLIGLAGLLILTATIIWLVAWNIGRPLQSLAEQATRHPASGRHSAQPVFSTGVAEIGALASGVDSLHGEVRKILGVLGTIGAEKDLSRLLGRVIREIVEMVGVHGGIVVLWDGRSEAPDDVRAYWPDAEVDDLTLPARSRKPKLTMYEALEREMTLHSAIYPGDPRTRLGPMKPAFIDPSIARADIICVPLCDRSGRPLGVFSLTRRVRKGEENAVSFPPDLTEFIEAVAAAIGIVLETQDLIKGQHDLRDALIHILAGAIDAKSPYTGGHCARVPAIFHMLLQAAQDAKEGPLKDFSLDEDGWEAARLAAWLHDCGKITTPEYVVDKATKLETLYDRIHEIRARFEILKRDAEIASLRAVAAGADAETERRKLEESLRRLDEEFAFVASCNAGVESMDEDDRARLAAIGQRTWVRTLDKRLGVSREELARMNRAGVEPAPACETLLADQPEHIIPRGEKDRLPADARWGFKLSTPEALYNRGELYNLLIPRGTLTPEERYKINDHITQTIIMLERLPLPKELADVPKIAGVHHERMDGKGYPRGLAGDAMDLQGRMMAIADIFEALTASDRPYKSSKKLSEALRIMEGMKKGGHIDPDLYDLFIATGIPQRYAAEYLAPEQNDM